MNSVKNEFVKSPGILRIIDAIESLRGKGHRRCPPNLLVTGESGSGKSTLIEHLIKRYPRRASENDDKDIVPLVHLSFPKDVSQLYMLRTLLKQLGDPDYRENDLDRGYEKLWKLLEECEVEILCIDEIHNIEHRLSRRVSPLARAFIKDISTHAKILIVGFGTNEAEALLETEEELDTRFQHFETMPVYSIYNGQRPVWATYLEKLSKCMDIDNPNFIYEADLPERLYFATRALPRTTANLIDYAMEMSLKNGRNNLTLEDFYQASLGLRQCRHQAKVFLLKSEKVRELASKGVYKNHGDKRSLDIIKDIFTQEGAFNEMIYQAAKAASEAKV